MAEALGLRTKKTTQSSVSQAEIVRLLKLDAAANEEFASQEDTTKTKGIGFGRLDTATFKTRAQQAESSSDNDSDNQEGTARGESGARSDAKRTRESGEGTDVKAAAKKAKREKNRKEKKEKKSKKEKKDRKEKKAKKARRHDD
ncbi:hypothetical protein BC830DRAFT_1085185 [Chytriomyces sp. MP71]|nr:hypothetical protein BC830DRAFT_1085185 [Chytriomyces sp. MP71]